MGKFKQLNNPHSHSDYSLDGGSTVSQIIEKNLELGATHVTFTEHGHMNSAMELYVLANKKGAKPILGIEAYMVNPFYEEYVNLYKVALKNKAIKPKGLRGKKTDLSDADIESEAKSQAMGDTYLHVTVHFRTPQAYQYFCKISKAMWERSIVKVGETKPMITIEELMSVKGQVTIGSSCMRGPVQWFLLGSRNGLIKPDTKRAEHMYLKLKEIAQDGFFVEVFPHSVTHEWVRPEKDDSGRIVKPGYFKENECSCEHDKDRQKPLNQFVLELAKKHKDPALISLDSHFANPEHKAIQDSRLGNGQENWRFHESYHILSTDEAAEKLKASLGVSDKDIEEWVDNSYQWASKFNDFKLETSENRWILAGDSERFLNRLKSTIDKYGRMDWSNQEMMDRLKMEIEVLAYNSKINLLAYFETIEDIANFCKENDVLLNVRGSAGGSLLLYLIGVSGINPLKHGLSFGRFLTEGRIKANTLPDVDMDVSDQGKVIQYLNDKYGDSVCRLSTNVLLKLKSSIKDAERTILGSVRKETEDLTKALPQTPQGVEDYDFVFGYTDESGVHNQGLLESNEKLQKYADANPEVWAVVTEMMGVQRNKGSHACGYLITDNPVTDYMPIIQAKNEWVTAFSPKWAEAAGGVKFDLLGVNTLKDIQAALRSIKERTGVILDPWNLPDDSECWENFGLGYTESVFQFDTPTVRPYLIATKPKTIDQIAAITALCRPGTLDAPENETSSRTLSEVFVARSKGEATVYVNNDLEPILGETNGVQLYQEQTIEIFKKIAEMDDAEADEVRRGIGKKNMKVLNDASNKLKEAALKKGWTEDQVNLLIKQIMASANYAFNKSHAVSYAYVAYACMYLKTRYPLDWWKAILSNSSKDELASKFWRHVSEFTLLPDINSSTDTYELKNDKIIAPFSILNGVGEKAYHALMKGKPYTSIHQYISTHHSKRAKDSEEGRSAVNTGISLKLIAAGVLDSLFPEGMPTEEKLMMFEKIKGEIRKEKPKKVPEEYIGMTSLGKYMIKKQLITIHSDDLRDIVLPKRGGLKVESAAGHGVYIWMSQDKRPIIDGFHLEKLKEWAAENDMTKMKVFLQKLLPKDASINWDLALIPGGQDVDINTISYVIEEKAFSYQNKSKQATKVVLDCNGTFSEEVLWPAYGTSLAPMGYKGLIALATYKISHRGISLRKLDTYIKQEDLEKYNMS
jgi:DNA polymerase-3 subunit alpha